ncbi:MAG: hypothetical protein RBR69_04405 [Candidatus Cloacimonadaceae bacterium]|jgi:hypothetical protein|nr:hypothetical protein [Candidatus Cloacimonadota bacterium]MDD3533756.1 hypothetical protein [Candidatus Cloacimonadota bacterium]MDY0127350.1 hypothetical protein [Candidatus Cloacimonadaceae bacterium]
MKEKIGIQDIKDMNKIKSRYDELMWLSDSMFDLLNEIPNLETDDIKSRYCELKIALSETPVLVQSDTESFNTPKDVEELNNILTAYKDELNNRRVPLPSCN